MEERPVCTITSTGKYPFTQHMYRCKTCNFADDELMCESCAKFCHANHNVVDCGFKIGYCCCGYGCSHCHCFCESPVKGDMDVPENIPRQCSCRSNGNNCYEDVAFHCNECGLIDHRCLCGACRYMCHSGHNCSTERSQPNFRCECGGARQNTPCLIKPPSEIPEPIPLCTFLITGKDSHMTGKSYLCRTCYPDNDEITICPACAKRCHKGHELVETPYARYYCHCGSGECKEPCQMMAEIDPAL